MNKIIFNLLYSNKLNFYGFSKSKSKSHTKMDKAITRKEWRVKNTMPSQWFGAEIDDECEGEAACSDTGEFLQQIQKSK